MKKAVEGVLRRGKTLAFSVIASETGNFIPPVRYARRAAGFVNDLFGRPLASEEELARRTAETERLEVLAEAFPNARIITAAPVVDDIWRSLPLKIKRWGPMLGANGPHHPVVPEALAGNSFTLEGNEIRVLGPMQGDHVHATALWVPSINTLIAGDLLSDAELDDLLGRYAHELRLKILGLEELERRGTGPSFGSPRQKVLWQAINARALALHRSEEEWARNVRWAAARVAKEISHP